MKTTEEKIKVMQASLDGKPIEIRDLDGGSSWNQCNHFIEWNWSRYDYRIKPEPREWWILPSVLGGNNYPYMDPSNTGLIRVREVL